LVSATRTGATECYPAHRVCLFFVKKRFGGDNGRLPHPQNTSPQPPSLVNRQIGKGDVLADCVAIVGSFDGADHLAIGINWLIVEALRFDAMRPQLREVLCC
jgi:hypothetical protein